MIKKMEHKKAKLCAVLWLGLGLTGLHAQEAIPVTGGNTSGSGGSVSYSVGQVADNTNIGITGSEAQGVQQPYEISVVTGLDEVKEISLTFSAYPNPSSDYIILKAENCKSENLTYQLLDLSGKALESKKLDRSETIIGMNNFVSATYLLKIIHGNKEVKTFKIVKY
jgi:hypothetical protein